MSEFYTILTNVGRNKLAAATANGSTVRLTQMRLGDGNGASYNPTDTQTSLRREVWRGNVTLTKVDPQNPNWIVVEVDIPASVGGFMIREAGIFDSDGVMIAVSKYPETYKPIVSEGSAKELKVRTIIEVSNASSVTLNINPGVILVSQKQLDKVIENTTPRQLMTRVGSDRMRSVIALCILDNSDVSLNSHTIGRITFNRHNGNNPIGFVDISMNKRYNRTVPTVTWSTQGLETANPVSPCTFTYRGVKYGGISVNILESRHSRYEFHGTSTMELFEVAYQRSPNHPTDPNEVLNEEIFDSINFNDVSIEGWFTQNGNRVASTDRTLWQGSISAEGSEITLADAVNNYTQLKIYGRYYASNNEYLIGEHLATGTSYVTRDINLADGITSTTLNVAEIGVTRSGNRLRIDRNLNWKWDGKATTNASKQNTDDLVTITRIMGVRA